MHKFLKIVALFLATLLPAHAQAANTFGTDFSDLWWNPQESGWGANLAHQGDTIFMTLFAYGSDSKPKWYVASSMASRNADETTHAFDGTLYETTGPYLGSAFNPADVTMRAVGSASLLFSGINSATLSYSIDGVNVSKQVTRQTFRNNNLGGSYFGAQVGDKSFCGAEDGPIESVARYAIVHSGSYVEITATLSDVFLQCVYTGDYIQQGSVGEIQGTYSCSNGASGSFFAAEIEASDKGFLARYYATRSSGCVESGIIGGAKR